MGYRQIILIRKDLNMGIGKTCAQASHASMAFLIKIIKEHIIGKVYQGSGFNQEFMKTCNAYRVEPFDIDEDLYEQWINGIFTKTVCEAKNKNHLMKAVAIAESLGLKEGEDFFLIKDCCLTDLEPEEIDEDGIGRTLTCIGFKPLPDEIAHQISKKYQLYK